MFLDIVISVEDCFEIRVGMKALFPASGFRHNFEMAHSGGVVDRDFLIFAHGVIDITGKDNFLPFLVNLKHSKKLSGSEPLESMMMLLADSRSHVEPHTKPDAKRTVYPGCVVASTCLATC